MRTWTRRGDGADLRICSNLESYECQLLASMVGSTSELLIERADSAPRDELTELTGIRTGHTTAPRDVTLGRLLPDFHRPDQEEAPAAGPVAADLNGGLRSINEPQIIDAKLTAARVLLDTLPADGGDVELTPAQADEWLTALNDVRLALGAMLGITDEPHAPCADDPYAGHYDVYQWLTVVQELLVEALTGAY
ncbi:oxidative stress transcriptional regulator AosR [Gordonia iterans]